MSNLTIRETNNEKFPYDLRDIQKAVGSTGSHSGFFKDQSKKFDWKEGMEYYEHELKTRKYLGKLDSQFSNNRSIPIAEKHIFITKKAALQVALSLKTPEARALANYLLDRMEANEKALKEIKEKGFEKVYGKEVRKQFTTAFRNAKPDATPSDYVQITYATKAHSGIPCNKKKEDFTLNELRRNNAIEAAFTLKVNDISNPTSKDIANCIKDSADAINTLAPPTTPSLFYDKNYSQRDGVREKIVELVRIIATVKGMAEVSVWNDVYRDIYNYFHIDIYKIWEKYRKGGVKKIDIITGYGAVSVDDGDMIDLGDWVVDYLTLKNTEEYKTLIE